MTNTAKDGFTAYLEDKARNELLKWAAGKQIFCQKCQNILDWKTTVLIEATSTATQQKATVIMCSNCYSHLNAQALKDQGLTLEITQYIKPEKFIQDMPTENQKPLLDYIKKYHWDKW